MTKTVSCIIPAYNEEKGIRNVLAAVVPLIGTELCEVIVVDDGSRDATRRIVAEFPSVHLIAHTQNEGKSKSVADGIIAARGELILLLDADLRHLTPDNVRALLAPVASGWADVALSYRKNAWPLFPFKEIDYLTGERVLARASLLSAIDHIASASSYGLEVLINRLIINKRMRLAIVSWPNVENNFHQHKQGWWRGSLHILRIWGNVLSTVSPVEMYMQNLRMRRLRVHASLSAMKLSIVIPAYNEEVLLAECLASVMRELEGSLHDTEVIVVNNRSTDRTREVALGFPKVRVVDEMQQGLVHARKAGFLASTGALIANIDADTRLPRGWIDATMREFAAGEHVVAVSGPFIYDDLPRVTRHTVKLFYVVGYCFYAVNHFILGRGAMLQGGNFIVRRDVLIAAGGYDTSIEFYGEDTDIARRMSRKGRVVWTFRLPMYTSGRRLREEGIVMTGVRYAANFLWITLFGVPLSKRHKDIRI